MTNNGIFTLRKEDELAIVTFDVPDQTMNTWNDASLASFRDVIEILNHEHSLRGAIFISGKPHTFHSGADLKTIEKLNSAEQVKKDIDHFQYCMNSVASLKIPTLAAIHGHCLGGGLEFALACTARLAKESNTTFLGLPETLVGLFPSGGGTQRLTRLIGYPAIDLILSGKTVSAAEAFKLGIVDHFIPSDADLLQGAKTFLTEIISGTAKLKRPEHDFSRIDDVMKEARTTALKAARGRELPGPSMAMKAILEGLKVSLREGLEIEKKCFIEAALSKEAKGSINTFFLKGMTDKPLSMMTKGFSPKPIRKALVLGFGTMGRGITIDILNHMVIPVIVKDMPEALAHGKTFVKKILDGMAEKKRLKLPAHDLMNLLTVTSDYTDEMKDADIVIEAVFEDINTKREVYRELCQVVTEECVIASNTSFLSLDTLADWVVRPERFAGLHFFSPVWMMQLVEVVRGEKTGRDTIDRLISFAASIKKRPLVCRNNKGFVVNAVLSPYISNSLQYLEEGNPIEKIDRAMLSFGMPVGPIRLLDEVGHDVNAVILRQQNKEVKTITNLVQHGRFGLKKCGKGLFLKDGSVDPDALPLIAKRASKERTEQEIQMGIFEDMVRNGKDLLDRHIVDDPRMIDLGVIWGAGFPADKGGVMKWADLTGLSERMFGKRFYP